MEEYSFDQYQLVSTNVQKSKRLKSKEVHLESEEGPSPSGILTDVADLLCFAVRRTLDLLGEPQAFTHLSLSRMISPLLFFLPESVSSLLLLHQSVLYLVSVALSEVIGFNNRSLI